jgi:hypothetical protein
MTKGQAVIWPQPNVCLAHKFLRSAQIGKACEGEEQQTDHTTLFSIPTAQHNTSWLPTLCYKLTQLLCNLHIPKSSVLDQHPVLVDNMKQWPSAKTVCSSHLWAQEDKGPVPTGQVIPSEWCKPWHLSKKSLLVMLALSYISLLFSYLVRHIGSYISRKPWLDCQHKKMTETIQPEAWLIDTHAEMNHPQWHTRYPVSS